MDASSQVARESKEDEETFKRVKRQELKALNIIPHLGKLEYTPWSALRLFTPKRSTLKGIA